MAPCLAIFLLVTAAIKVYDVVVSYSEYNGLPTNYHLHVGAIQAEILCAIWLLSGLAPNAARAAALVLFGLFAIVSWRFALLGLPCPCFGRLLIVNGWVTFCLDLLAIGALLVSLLPTTPEDTGDNWKA